MQQPMNLPTIVAGMVLVSVAACAPQSTSTLQGAMNSLGTNPERIVLSRQIASQKSFVPQLAQARWSSCVPQRPQLISTFQAVAPKDSDVAPTVPSWTLSTTVTANHVLQRPRAAPPIFGVRHHHDARR